MNNRFVLLMCIEAVIFGLIIISIIAVESRSIASLIKECRLDTKQINQQESELKELRAKLDGEVKLLTTYSTKQGELMLTECSSFPGDMLPLSPGKLTAYFPPNADKAAYILILSSDGLGAAKKRGLDLNTPEKKAIGDLTKYVEPYDVMMLVITDAKGVSAFVTTTSIRDKLAELG